MLTGLEENTVFAGRYRVVRRLAAGAMGAVYEVIHLDTERRRALKVMLPELIEDAEMRERFQREARIGARIDSEHIVEVFDAGVDAATGMPFLVMELLRGEELGQRLKRLGRLAPAEVVTYVHQAAMALDRAHGASIVHRDLKPANLFLTQRDDGSPRVKILDFGIAKLINEGTGKLQGTAVGTPLYMAPEQLLSGAVSPATDIYALGMCAYTLLTGKVYWSEEAASQGGMLGFALIAKDGPREPPSARAARLGASLPAAFDAWFLRATAARPESRFPTAGASAEALAEALGVRPIASSLTELAPVSGSVVAGTGPGFGGTGGTRRTGQAPAARQRSALIAAAVVLVAATGAVVWLMLGGGAAPAAQPEGDTRSAAASSSGGVTPPAASAGAPAVAPAGVTSADTQAAGNAVPSSAAPAATAEPRKTAAPSARPRPPSAGAPTTTQPGTPPRIYSPD